MILPHQLGLRVAAEQPSAEPDTAATDDDLHDHPRNGHDAYGLPGRSQYGVQCGVGRRSQR